MADISFSTAQPPNITAGFHIWRQNLRSTILNFFIQPKKLSLVFFNTFVISLTKPQKPLTSHKFTFLTSVC
jgi:hypothetical protein